MVLSFSCCCLCYLAVPYIRTYACLVRMSVSALDSKIRSASADTAFSVMSALVRCKHGNVSASVTLIFKNLLAPLLFHAKGRLGAAPSRQAVLLHQRALQFVLDLANEHSTASASQRPLSASPSAASLALLSSSSLPSPSASSLSLLSSAPLPPPQSGERVADVSNDASTSDSTHGTSTSSPARTKAMAVAVAVAVTDALLVLLQHMCLRVPEKAAFRAVMSKSVSSVLRAFPRLHAAFVPFLVRLARHAKVTIRSLAVEMAAALLPLLLASEWPESEAERKDSSDHSGAQELAERKDGSDHSDARELRDESEAERKDRSDHHSDAQRPLCRDLLRVLLQRSSDRTVCFSLSYCLHCSALRCIAWVLRCAYE